jgi:outer membrane protein assembly factor BamD (BamD/ComL family)
VLNVKARTLPVQVRRLSLFLFVFLAASLIHACSVGGYLTAYFNTYFNASRLFSEAEEEILAQADPNHQDTTFLTNYNLSSATKTKLTSVVEKCSKILQYHQETGLVDDALMMIGKSYYYQNELQKAERKFAELIEAYPDGGLTPEAKLLLAYTYYRMKDPEQAVAVAAALADSTGGDEEEISARAFRLLGQVRFDAREFSAAREAYRHAASLAGTDTERAAAHMQIAEMSVRLGEFEDALAAFRDAEDHSGDYRGEYTARINQVRVLNRLHRYDEALEELEDLRSNSNFKEFYAEADLETANTLNEKGEYQEAMELYYSIDTSYARTEVAALSHFQLGHLYEKVYHDYDSALAVYQRGRSHAPQAPITAELGRRHDLLREMKTLKTQIATLESLKTAILSPPPEPPEDTVAAKDSVALGSGADSTTAAIVRPPLPSLDSVQNALARHTADLAGLYYSGLEFPDSAKVLYKHMLSEYPETPYSAKSLYTLAQIYSQDGGDSAGVVDSLYRHIIDRYPDSEFAEESRRILGLPPRERVVDGAEIRYAEAEALLLSNQIGRAISMLDSIVVEHPVSPVAAKAAFAVAWVYEELLDMPDSAIVHYKRVVAQFPSSIYADSASKKLKDVPENFLQRHQLSLIDSTNAEGGNSVPLPPREGTVPVPPELVPEEVDEDSTIQLPPEGEP